MAGLSDRLVCLEEFLRTQRGPHFDARKGRLRPRVAEPMWLAFWHDNTFARIHGAGLARKPESHVTLDHRKALFLTGMSMGRRHVSAGWQGEIEDEQAPVGLGGGRADHHPLATYGVVDHALGGFRRAALSIAHRLHASYAVLPRTSSSFWWPDLSPLRNDPAPPAVCNLLSRVILGNARLRGRALNNPVEQLFEFPQPVQDLFWVVSPTVQVMNSTCLQN